MKITTIRPSPTAEFPNIHRGGAQPTYAFAILNKASEPRAILVAWLELSPQHRSNAHVISVMRSLSKGRDPNVEALQGFLSLCGQAGVEVVVGNADGAHQGLRVYAGLSRLSGQAQTKRDGLGLLETLELTSGRLLLHAGPRHPRIRKPEP